jgi:hypothetical protein
MTDDVAVSLHGDAKQILLSHLDVGRKKPVSYLPIRTVEKVIGITVQEYRSMIETAGNQCSVFGAEDCCINSGAVYAYSHKDLSAILDNNRSILLNHKWPVAAEDFVRRMASEWLDEDSPIIPIIRKAFGEESG